MDDEDEDRSTAEWQRCQMLWKLMEIRETIVIYHHLQFSISSRDSRRNSHVDDDDDDDDNDDDDDDDDDSNRLSNDRVNGDPCCKLNMNLRSSLIIWNGMFKNYVLKVTYNLYLKFFLT